MTASPEARLPDDLCVGDVVDVLSAIRRGHVQGSGVIEKIAPRDTGTLYWVSGFPCARAAEVLRKKVG